MMYVMADREMKSFLVRFRASQKLIHSRCQCFHGLGKMNNSRPKSKLTEGIIIIDASIVFTPLGDAASRILTGHKKWAERASNASGRQMGLRLLEFIYDILWNFQKYC